jgi:WD40 repeat protein
LLSPAASLDCDAPQECDTTPIIPINVISHLVLPFVHDRRTWNAVCSTNKELYEAGMRMKPPWPETKLKLLGQRGVGVGALKFSPCGSFLASGSGASGDSSSSYLLHVCDRHGRQTCLGGHTSGICALSFSIDGNYLASTGCRGNDTLIRIWPTNSTKFPQQSDKTLQGQQETIHFLDFSPNDSNLLVSGDSAAMKLWNVEQEVCIYSFNHGCGAIRSLCFPALDEGNKCIFVSSTGSLIRTCWDDLSGITSDIVDMPGLGEVQASAFSPCGSLFAAASPLLGNAGPDSYTSTLYNMISMKARPESYTFALYNMVSMTVVQRLTIFEDLHAPAYLAFSPDLHAPTFLAFSPDGKTLVLDSTDHEIHICEVHDLNIRRRIGQEYVSNWAVAFDPSSQCLASAGRDPNVRLWTI